MPLMGSLYIGASGLQTAQNALNTTSHNLANVGTEAYTRQQVQLGTRTYNIISRSGSAVAMQQYGLGVVYSETKQVRDTFLDKTYRRESGRSAFYDVSYEAINETEDLLQEMDGERFAESMENLWASIQELAKDPSSATNQGLLVQRSTEFMERAQAVYDGLSSYQDNLNDTIKKDINTINELGERLVELNNQVLKIEPGGLENANDLRDQRNKILDDLSKMAYISYYEDDMGNVCVKIEGTDFVTPGSVKKIGLDIDTSTGFYTPYWEHLAARDADGNVTSIDGAHVFNTTQEISTSMNTDIGGVKATMIARGDHRATAADLDDSVNGEGYYDKNISNSVMMNVMAEFDQLIKSVATEINRVLKEAAESAETENPGCNYMKNTDGEIYQLFEIKTPDGGWTTGNILVNAQLRQEPSLLSFIKADSTVDYETAEKLKEVFTTEDYVLNPNVATKTNLTDYYSSLVSQVANSGSVYKSISENQQQTVKATEEAREQILGVSSDEELEFMIQFQNAFNASSRYFNVVSEMLEHIINTLGT